MKYLILTAVLIFSPLTALAHSQTDFLDLIDETKQSVVYIVNNVKDGAILPSITAPPPAPLEEDEAPRDRKSRFTGTGFVIHDGYIVTNEHVINGHGKVEFYFEDNPKPYEAEVIGYDKSLDIAVLKSKEPLPASAKPLEWGLYKLRAGMEIWVVGHPGGLTYSVSKGIISHVDRRLNSPWQQTLQIDAAVNKGNSGGPLLDMDGKVVGVNVMIISRVSEFNGIALSIDAGAAARGVDTIILNGKIVRPLMGVALGVSEETYQVQAKEITPGGAADIAGIQSNDLYVSIDGIAVNVVNDVFDILSTKMPGDHIRVKMLRAGAEIIFDVMLGEKPEQVTPVILEPEED